MDTQVIQEAHRMYMKSAETIYQLTTRLWVGEYEAIALPKLTLSNNIKVMIEVKNLIPELHATQVLKQKCR